MSISKTQRLYRQVIDRVIQRSESDFFTEGLDNTALAALQEKWEEKLIDSGAIAPVEKEPRAGSDADSEPDDERQRKRRRVEETPVSPPVATTTTTTTTTSTTPAAAPAPAPAAAEGSDEGSILGSDDDLSDEEDNVEADDIVLCQFEKVARTRNRWKCTLTSGVAHLDGRDYLFARGQTDAEFK